MVKEALNKFKVIHILVNDAGIDRNVPLLEETEKGWDSVMGVNLKGTFNCMQAVLPYMVKERYGKIVNLSSCMGVGVPGPAAYGATKAAIV